jgi:ATP-binding protein involved in chromosome partitioning
VRSERLESIGRLEDPWLELTLDEAGFLAVDDGADVTLALPGGNWPTRDQYLAAIDAQWPGARVSVRAMNEDELMALRQRIRSRMLDESGAPRFLQRTSKTRVLGISSGKGGVGKSSVSVNLALALAQSGQRVGLLDADVYGFSVPKMIASPIDPIVLGDTVIPALAHGVHCVSMGYFVPDDQAVIWRGPMLHKAISQLVSEAAWGEPDFLVIDMPPGTGDVALTLSEIVPRAEIMVVTTPQSAAQRVAQRSASAARKLKLPVRGVIENMSYFRGEDGRRYEIFGSGGGTALAEQLGVPLLGQIPLEMAVREGGDEGQPVVVAHPESEAARAFVALAAAIVAQGPTRVYRPELTIS